MKHKLNIGIFLVLCFLTTKPGQLFAQFRQLPTPVSVQKTSSPSNARTQSSPLELPFWDDFSSAGIDPDRWISDGASHSFTVGISAPTLGVAMLDGTDESGRPYAREDLQQGEADELISLPINLSNIQATEANTVFLSFYWQAGGKAEMPDENDRLTLQFLSPTGDWIEVWSQNGGDNQVNNIFRPVSVQVRPEFFHGQFQFRFRNRGRLSGPFDSWLLDYVFLNKKRSANNLIVEDRALTQANQRPLGKFGAVPLSELPLLPEIWQRTGNEFNNLNNRFRAMEFSIELQNNGQLVKRINTNTPFNPVPLALERRSFVSNEFGSIPSPSTETDLELVTYLSSGDDFFFELVQGDTLFFPQVDFRKNDTVRTVIPIRDFYAYDNGNVDYSAGINQRGGMLVNRYEAKGQVFLKGISINFTNPSQVGRGLDLMVWKNLDSAPIHVQEIFIPAKETLESFAYFEIEKNVPIQGEFYIGFAQFTNDFIFVGLDKSYDNGQEVFFNVSGSWQQNQEVSGSLMIRPHLSQTGIQAENKEEIFEVKVFPNPVTDRLFVEGTIESVQVFDSFGREINLPQERLVEGHQLDFTGQRKGIYLINIRKKHQVITRRILVN